MRRTAVVFIAVAIVATACKRKSETPATPNEANRVAVRSVQLYYESPSLLLAPETRNVPLPESPAAALPVVARELLKGPASAQTGLLRLFPEDTIIRGAYLLPGGTAVVDLGGATLTEGWGTGSHRELMAAYSIVQTITANFADAKRVRIIVNGTPAETLAGHVSLAESLAPKPALVAR